MSLRPGDRLGPYEVQSLIGAGGMGEVYQARDTRLERKVAIKVLPGDLAADPERRQRFDREAKTISALNHAHICTLYDVGDQDGTGFLVMEHLEGETLGERLRRGALPLEQALTLATEIADALSAAHRQGVIHRDLKPGNVMLTKTGVKLLDFGLAKLRGHGDQPVAGTLVSSPTLSEPLTGQGTILGTLQYMAPEQLEGQPADARTDLFAFGAIVYEMVTGCRAFEGASAASLIGAILEREPEPIPKKQPLAPRMLDRLVRKCLAKAPDDRWESAHDVAEELKWIGESLGEPQSQPTVTNRGWRQPLLWGLVGFGVAAIGFAAVVTLRPETQPQSALHLNVGFPAEAPLADATMFALSPDGRQLAYRSLGQLAVRDLASGVSRHLPGTQGATFPFFKPDGRWVAFFAGQKLWTVPLEHGLPVELCDAPSGRGGSWSDQGFIVFAPSFDSGLMRVSESGGQPQALTTLSEEGDASHRWPHVLPGGEAVLFVGWKGGSWDTATITGLSLRTGQQRVIINGGTAPQYLPTGHLVFGHRGQLLAVPFDLNTLMPSGSSVPVLDDVVTSARGNGATAFAWSAAGTVAWRGNRVRNRRLVWVDRQGVEQPTTLPVSGYADVALSPDGRRVVTTVVDKEQSDVWIGDIERGTLTPLTTASAGTSRNPVWSPDGRRVAYGAFRGDAPERIYSLRGDGSGVEERVTVAPGIGWHRPTDWPTESQLLIHQTDPMTGQDIAEVDLGKDGQPETQLATAGNETGAVLSPDGRWLAYQSNETGRAEVYVCRFPSMDDKRQVSTGGGWAPSWRRHGLELYYVGPDVAGMKVAATEFGPGGPHEIRRAVKVLSGAFIAATTATRPYAVSQDGERFLMIRPSPEEYERLSLDVVVGWFQELLHRVPTRP